MMAALRNKRFLVFGGAAALCLLFLGGSVIVHLRQFYALTAQRAAAARDLANLKTAVEGVDIDKLKLDNQELADELSEIERSLPEREYMPTLIRQIESGAAMTKNDLLELRQGEIRTGLTAGAAAAGGEGDKGEGAADKGGGTGGEATAPTGQRYSEMDMEVRLDGSFMGAFDFVRHLGKIGKIISVETLEIEKAGAKTKRADGRAGTTIRLDCKAYILEPRSGFPGQVTARVF